LKTELIRQGHTVEMNERVACQELADRLEPAKSALSLLFFSDNYQLDKLSLNIKEFFGNGPVIACTTAGEVSPVGFLKEGSAGISFDLEAFCCDLVTIENINSSDALGALSLKEKIKKIELKHKSVLPLSKSFAILIIDGLSLREEVLVELLSGALDGMPLVGGSAADGLNFSKTRIYSNQEFKQDNAVIAIMSTTTEFRLIMGHHFSETQKKCVITKASPETRIVYEIDGIPAANFYADTLGLKVADLNSEVFSSHPVTLKIGEENYVRSIKAANPDLSLSFYCSIDEGIVLTLAKGNSLYEESSNLLDDIAHDLKGLEIRSLFFECILRRLEIINLPPEEIDKISKLYNMYNAIGFHTYGEQYCGVHLNQTLTGVMFGFTKK